MDNKKSAQSGCCPKFSPAPWDEKNHDWKDKKFIRGKVFTLFYMPINFGSVITRLLKKAELADAQSQDWLCLSDHTSLWNMDIYLAVEKHVPDAENITLNGQFVSKVYEGPFSDTGKWVKDFSKFLKSRREKLRKMYMWYTTCPKCAKKYGKNYTVIFGKVS
jgi:hypothetical protein